MESVTEQSSLQKIIKEPTHISNTLSPSIDLILTSQTNLMADSAENTLHCIQIVIIR